VLKGRRDFPPILKEAEEKVERWRGSLLRQIHSRLDVAIFLLTRVACDHIFLAFSEFMPHDPSRMEITARRQLFGLQFSLSGLEGELPPGRFAEGIVADALRTEELLFAHKAIQHMSDYSRVRDAFLTYKWGGYELENPSENVFKFVDCPDWQGRRDYAQIIITQEIKEREGLNALPSLHLSHNLMVKVLFQKLRIPPSLQLREVRAKQFLYAWLAISLEKRRPGELGPQVIKEETFVSMMDRLAQLSVDEAKSFLKVTTFERQKKSNPLTLLHCPIIKVTERSFVLIPWGFILGNPFVCMPRLAVHRGKGFDNFIDRTEEYLLQSLEAHFGSEEVTIKTRFPYKSKYDSGDIDLVVYEKATNRLLLAQVKAFIPPDTVEETIRANEKLGEGLRQAERMRSWWQGLSENDLGAALNLPLGARPQVSFAVFGNGFAGSDYLPIPDGIVLVNAYYLLMSQFAGKSVFDAITQFQQRIDEESVKAGSATGSTTLQLGNITFEIPGMVWRP
jgi:hypothetical protein